MSADTFLWPYTFVSPSGLRFEISVAAWTLMQCFRQHEPHQAEAGGVLLGRHLRDGSAIIVDAITTPLPGDRQSRTRFFPYPETASGDDRRGVACEPRDMYLSG